MILVNNRELIIPNNERQLGTTYDSRTTNRTFSIKRDCTDGVDLSNLDFRLDLKYRENRTIYSLTKATTITNGSLHVNKFVFLDKLSTAGTYVFTYDGTKWNYNSAEADLSEYGITIKEGTPASGNTITITLTTSTSDLDTLELDKSVSDDTIILNWLVTNSQLLVPGVVYVQMRAMNGTDVKWSSYEGTFFVESHINVPGSYGDLSELEQLEQDFKSLEGHTEENIVQAEKWATGKHNNVPVTSDEPQYHNNAKYYVEQAEIQVGLAEDQVELAEEQVTLAAAQVTLAENQVTLAQGHANTASGYADDASDSADDASGYATTASGYATNAGNSATSASGSATLSESWAKGGTSTRSGEDTNNSKYYSEQAASSASQAASLIGKFVKVDVAQTFTDTEKAQGRANLGVGDGTGDMVKSTYDPTNKSQDIFAYADSAVSTHNSSASAHSSQFDNKVDKVTGKGLSTEDYTTAEKTKLSGIADGAEVNVQSDWSQASSSADDYIKNKPTQLSAFTDNLGSNPTHTHSTLKVKKKTITIGTSWTSETGGFKNDISNQITFTANTKVDLQPSNSIISSLIELGIVAMYVENNGTNLYVHIVGDESPSESIDIQATYVESEVAS